MVLNSNNKGLSKLTQHALLDWHGINSTLNTLFKRSAKQSYFVIVLSWWSFLSLTTTFFLQKATFIKKSVRLVPLYWNLSDLLICYFFAWKKSYWVQFLIRKNVGWTKKTSFSMIFGLFQSEAICTIVIFFSNENWFYRHYLLFMQYLFYWISSRFLKVSV